MGKGYKQVFLSWYTNRKYLRYTNGSTSLVNREMSNHNKMPPHTTNMAKKADNKKYWQRCGTGTLIHCRWERKIMQPLWKRLSIPQKLNMELPYVQAIPLLNTHLRTENMSTKSCTWMFLATFLIIARKLKAQQWMKE